MDKNWKVLKDKDIVAILDGDTPLLRWGDDRTISMPHLSAKDIVYKIGKPFGFFIPFYDKQRSEFRSRRQLFFDLIEQSNNAGRTRDVLLYIMSKKHFRNYIEQDLQLDVSYCKTLIPQIQKEALKRINDVLYTDDLKLSDQMELVSLDSPSMKNNEVNYKSHKIDDFGFYILPFCEKCEDVMKAVQNELINENIKLNLVKAGDIFDDSYGSDIPTEIKDRIKKAKVIVCDISTFNANVFYELGFATALNKHVIVICHNEDFEAADNKLPLDISTKRVQFYEVGYEKEILLAKNVVKKIQSILANRPVYMNE